MTDEHSSLLRELAHELRDALSPIRPALDLLRLRNFDAEASKSTAQRVERGLERALATIDAFVIAEQCENGTAALVFSATPPIVTVGVVARGAAVVINWPLGTGGFVAPNPVPYSMMISPSVKGVLVTPVT